MLGHIGDDGGAHHTYALWILVSFLVYAAVRLLWCALQSARQEV